MVITIEQQVGMKQEVLSVSYFAERPDGFGITVMGDWQKLLTHLQERQVAQREGRVRGKKIIGVLDGGGMAGIFSAAIFKEFVESGLMSSFDELIAESVGSVVAVQAAIGNVNAMSTFKRIIDRNIINRRRPPNVLNVAGLREIFLATDGTGFDEEKLKESTTTVLVGYTDMSGQTVYKKANGHLTLVELIVASCNMPISTERDGVEVDGRLAVDGGMGDPDLIAYAMKTYAQDADDILIVLPVAPSNDTQKKLQNHMLDLALKGLGLPRGLRDAIVSMSERRNLSWQDVIAQIRAGGGPNIVVMHPMKPPTNEQYFRDFHPFSRNWPILRRVAGDVGEVMKRLLTVRIN